MASIVTKKIKGHEYMYLVESIRKGTHIKQKTIKYIGKKRPIPKEEFECMEMSYKKNDWILNEFFDELSYTDHHRMKKASDNYQEYNKTLDSVSREKEKEKFLSRFISYSNAIEGSTLTPNETFQYLFEGIAPSGHTKKELFMAANMLEAWHYLEKNCKRVPKKEDMFMLHKIVNKGIESDETLGAYKTIQNYIGDIPTASYLFVPERMAMLFSWIKKAYRKIDDFEVAFQSHAQFEAIHPFVDGNGRVGRLILNWLLMYKCLMPMAIQVKLRQDYISALNTARRGKVEAICAFCLAEYLRQYSFV